MTGEVLRRQSRTRLDWSGLEHFDRSPAGSVPCRCGDGPTAEQLTAELIGRPAPTTTQGDLR
jgi:hypothetical protein